MEFLVYAVKDELTGVFYAPMYFKTEVEAARYFKTQMNNTPNCKYNASDYAIYKLGTFNEETGVFTSNVSKEIGGRSVIDVNNSKE